MDSCCQDDISNFKAQKINVSIFIHDEGHFSSLSVAGLETRKAVFFAKSFKVIFVLNIPDPNGLLTIFVKLVP